MDQPIDVLLIEDDFADALLVKELLHDADPSISTHWFTSLAAATDELNAANGCILLDLNLPDAVGLEGLRTVLRTAPDATVIVLTGLTDRSHGLQAVAAGLGVAVLQRSLLARLVFTPEG